MEITNSPRKIMTSCLPTFFWVKISMDQENISLEYLTTVRSMKNMSSNTTMMTKSEKKQSSHFCPRRCAFGYLGFAYVAASRCRTQCHIPKYVYSRELAYAGPRAARGRDRLIDGCTRWVH